MQQHNVSFVFQILRFMTLWGINLDGVALINLIMCIGFSVDFSAHICYHYMTAEAEDIGGTQILHSSTRIRASLYALGLPIIQGAASTILGVFGLAFANCYLFVTFFKMIFLVILLGALHGLVLLPVLLSIFGPDQCRSIRKHSGKSKKLQSYESSAISTPTITTFSKRKIPNNVPFHVSNFYNGGNVFGFSGTPNIMKNNTNMMMGHPHQFSQHSVYESDEHDGIESICSCTINMGYMNDQSENNSIFQHYHPSTAIMMRILSLGCLAPVLTKSVHTVPIYFSMWMYMTIGSRHPFSIVGRCWKRWWRRLLSTERKEMKKEMHWLITENYWNMIFKIFVLIIILYLISFQLNCFLYLVVSEATNFDVIDRLCVFNMLIS